MPFGVFVHAIDEYLQALEPRRLDALDAETRGALSSVFPSLSRSTPPGEALQHERYRSHRAVRELLERLTATKPLVLVLDDVHWADPASVDLLGSLLRRPPDAAVLIALGLLGALIAKRKLATPISTELTKLSVREDVETLKSLGRR